MTSPRFEVSELADRWDEALAAAATAGEVIVTEQQVPRAKLLPIAQPAGPRLPELHPGALVPSDDFDAELPDGFWLGQP